MVDDLNNRLAAQSLQMQEQALQLQEQTNMIKVSTYVPPSPTPTQTTLPKALEISSNTNQDINNPSVSTYVPPSPTPTQTQTTSQENIPTASTTIPNNTAESISPKIPPIVLRVKKRWSMISKEITLRGWHFHKATNTSDGIKLYPTSIESYRGIIAFLESNKEEFHSYQLPEERLLQVVIRVPFTKLPSISPHNLNHVRGPLGSEESWKSPALVPVVFRVGPRGLWWHLKVTGAGHGREQSERLEFHPLA
ncbi:unnamed protein product [Brassicogethes aeneus]|uniref:Uncharacterized protein n=1 Tax=Brassicogethes aeneus TaxID=1431903 RepID=A0A9P0BGZ4_BRAAE|nr:unnamed protein product [Brassicogethes aeneus]